MKKFKKIIYIIIIAIIVLLIGQTSVFARITVATNTTNNTTTNNTTNSSNTTNSTNTKNTTNELSEKELLLEEKLKQNQESDDEDVLEEDEEDYESDFALVDDTEETITSFTKSNVEEIEEDIYLLETDEDIVYEKTYIDGNVYILSSKDISFDGCIIVGNVYIFSNECEITDTAISGNTYILGDNIIISDSYMSYAYLASKNIEIDTDTEIENDLKIVATSAIIDGIIGRDLDSITNYIELGDNIDIDRDINICTQTYEMPSKIEKSSSLNLKIIEAEEGEELSTLDLILNLLPELVVEFLIILIIAIIILGGSPKFTEVNRKLELVDFIKAFFAGILEIIIINVIAILLIATGYGMGYGIAILGLMMILIYFGKAIFIISFAIRLVKNKNKHIKIRAFIFTIVVAFVVELINIISVFGNVGFIINLVIDLILGVSGLGTFIKIILTSNKEKKKVDENSNDNIKVESEQPEVSDVSKVEEPIVIEKTKEVGETSEKQEVIDEDTKKEDKTKKDSEISKTSDETKEDKKKDKKENNKE